MSGVYTLKKIPNKSNQFVLGTYIGLSILKKNTNDKWSASIIKNIAFPVNNIEFESDSIIWLTHPYKGLYRAKIDFKKNSITEINPFTENSNLKDYKTKLYKVNDKLLFYNNNNYFTYSKVSKNFLLYKPAKYSDSFKNNDFVTDDNGGNWFVSKNKEIAYIGKDLSINFKLNSTQIKERLVTGFEKIIMHNDSIRFLNLNDGFVKFLFKKPNKDIKNTTITPIIDKIYTQEKELKVDDFKIEVPFKQAKLITIELYSPNRYENEIEFNLNGKNSYIGKSNNGKIQLQNLSYGNHNLNLKSIDSFYDSKTLTLAIRILRPWYLSYWMLVIYLLLFSSILFFVRATIKKKFKIEQIKIHKELVLNTQKKINKIEKENLKTEIKTKKKVLATITESIIKKNEIIIILKNELIRIAKTYPEQYISQKLLKVANDSISNNRDWKVFEESFNDLHEDFLKKLVYQFPKLTSKDLKLCAYIKTGYTSKDIAPLLGITVRGIEIQRYRLRKKMELAKDQSIFDFLISFE
jgi:DNA-binding CsgD family transcriptional regulator